MNELFMNDQYLRLSYNNYNYILNYNNQLNKLSSKGNNLIFNQKNIINLANDKLNDFLVRLADSHPIMTFGLTYKCVNLNESLNSCIIQINGRTYNIESLLFVFPQQSINTQNRMLKHFVKDFKEEYINFINTHKYVIFIICAEIYNNKVLYNTIDIDMLFYQNYPSNIIIQNYIKDYINSIFGEIDNIEWF